MSLNVKHYLDLYTLRKEMQDEGITNPSEQIKTFTKEFVEKLAKLPLDNKIILKDKSFFDEEGNLIMKMPID
jgi:hypothetical protein